MKDSKNVFFNTPHLIIFFLVITNISTLYVLNEKINQKKASDKNLYETSQKMAKMILALEQKIASSTIENRDLNDFLTILKARNSDFENILKEKDIKVANLEKLTSTDVELLKKYSKTYFLNENYVPNELSTIDPEFLLRTNVPEQIHTRVKPFLEAMLRAAKAENINIYVLSGYRSFETQKNIKSRHAMVYGSASNKFSADQGYSEHQLGTTVDLTTKATGNTLTSFEKDPAYKWLEENAHRFGFTLSYPKGNNFYIFEPWHWRFVGVTLSEYIHGQGMHLYDIDQRKMDDFLIEIFN